MTVKGQTHCIDRIQVSLRTRSCWEPLTGIQLYQYMKNPQAATLPATALVWLTVHLQMWPWIDTQKNEIHMKGFQRYWILTCKQYTYLCPCIIFPDNCISCMACSRHFTSSVGQSTRVAKAEAKEPAAAFCRSLWERNCWSYLGTDLECSGATAPEISSLNLYSKYQDKLTESWGKESPGERSVTWTRQIKT